MNSLRKVVVQGAYLTVELVFEEWRLDAWDYSVWLDVKSRT